VFSELLGTQALWVPMDRGSFKPPVIADHPDYHDESAMHWDRDPRSPWPYPVQEVLYLTDTADNQGAFQCVPALYRSLEKWLASHPDDASLREPDVSNYPLVRVGAPAGSVVIWNSLLPHGTVLSTFRPTRLSGEEPAHGSPLYATANVASSTRIRPRCWVRCQANDTGSFRRERTRKKLRTSS
jgi:hypothetical protein